MRSFSYARSLLVTLQRWRSHHSIHHSWKSHTTHKLHGSEPELLPTEVLHCRNKDFLPFLLLWPWPWPDDLHIRTWLIFPGDIPDVQIWTSNVKKAFKSYCLTDSQTDTIEIIYHAALRVVNNTWPKLNCFNISQNTDDACTMAVILLVSTVMQDSNLFDFKSLS